MLVLIMMRMYINIYSGSYTYSTMIIDMCWASKQTISSNAYVNKVYCTYC